MALEREISIVEDNNAELFLTQHLFEQNGYTVFSYANGCDAVAGLRGCMTHVVLIDLALPDIYGVDVYKRTKHLSHQPLFVSGLLRYTNMQSMAASCGLSADNFMAKPFDNTALLAQVAALYAREEHIRAERISAESIA